MKNQSDSPRIKLAPISPHSEGVCSKRSLHITYCQKLLWLLFMPLLLSSAVADVPYTPAPFTTNDWPWNINLTEDACTNPPAPYVIAGGVFDTSSLTAPPSVGPGGA